MQLRIRGKCKAIEREEIRYMVTWFLHRIIRPRLLNNIDVSLIIKKGLHKKVKYKASVVWNDTNHRPRSFLIEMDPKYGYRSIIDTLAHECWHIKQYSEGKLKDYNSIDACKWYSKVYEEGDLTYRKLPWEIEARKRARWLIKEYKEQSK